LREGGEAGQVGQHGIAADVQGGADLEQSVQPFDAAESGIARDLDVTTHMLQRAQTDHVGEHRVALDA
jgi:hypothetical protein